MQEIIRHCSCIASLGRQDRLHVSILLVHHRFVGHRCQHMPCMTGLSLAEAIWRGALDKSTIIPISDRPAALVCIGSVALGAMVSVSQTPSDADDGGNKRSRQCGPAVGWTLCSITDMQHPPWDWVCPPPGSRPGADQVGTLFIRTPSVRRHSCEVPRPDSRRVV